MPDESGTIIVIGSANTDMVALTDRFPAPGETVLGDRFLMNPGGKGANQAVAAARVGGQVTFIGKVGEDQPGRLMIRNLQAENIDTSFVSLDRKTHSGVAVIYVNREGENSIVIVPGSNMTLSKESVDRASERIEAADILLMQLEIPMGTILHAAQKGAALGKRVILNPAPAAMLPDGIFASLYMITPNISEAAILTGIEVTDEQTAAEAAEILIKKGVKNVVITMGPEGAYIHTDEISEQIEAPHIKAVDTTAAGDCFNGALAVALTRGDELQDAVRYANRAAALSATRIGAQSSLPYRRELES